MFERAALIHFSEIGLKGRNRAAFEGRLRVNLDAAVAAHTAARTQMIASRLVVPVTDDAGREAVMAACAAVPGVAWVGDAFVLSRAAHDMRRAAAEALREERERIGAGRVRTFAVDARRSNTDHPVSSSEMNVDLGAHLQADTGLAVDLRAPDVTVRAEVVQGEAYVYARRQPGPGGLPVGSSGTVTALLSAGIDSPVAAWRMMKRGAVVVGVHFSAAPEMADTSTPDVFDIAAALAPAGGLARVYAVPFGALQRAISLSCPPSLRVLLYRRLMVRVAEGVAAAEGARALVTGESLGQVASQTLDNIAAVDDAATLPVLRPLIGMDKSEIIAEARRLGTYPISVRPHDDCCTLFLPRRPETHATVEAVRDAERGLDVPSMVAEALASARRRDFPCAPYKPPPGAPGLPWEA